MLSNNDYKFFNKAKVISTLSDYTKTHIGCVAVYKGQIIGIGYNCNKTHPMQKYYNKYRIQSDYMLPKLHAEISCMNSIKNLEINFSKVKLYIYRTMKQQKQYPFGMSRPCPSCINAIKDLGIREIYYTTNNGFTYEKIGNIKAGDN